MGRQRSRLPDAVSVARGQEMDVAAGAQARQVESPLGAGGEDRLHGVSLGAEAAGVRRAALLRGMTFPIEPAINGGCTANPPSMAGSMERPIMDSS